MKFKPMWAGAEEQKFHIFNQHLLSANYVLNMGGTKKCTKMIKQDAYISNFCIAPSRGSLFPPSHPYILIKVPFDFPGPS